MSADPLLWLGLLACCALAAAALLPGPPRRRLALAGAALVLAPVLIAADNWSAETVRELRERPLLAAALGAALGAAVALLAGLFLRRPILAPLAIVAALPFRVPITLADATVNLLLPLYGVLAAALLAALMRPASAPPAEPDGRAAAALPWALATFLLLWGVQAAYADELSGAVESAAFFFAPFAGLYLLLSTWRWDARLARLAAAVVVAEMLVVSLVGYAQFASGELFWNEKVIAGNEAHAWFRVNSLFWDPNIMGRYLAVAMVLVAAVVAWGGRERSVGPLVFGLMLAALVITFSQSAFLALIAGILVLGLLRWRARPAAAAAAATVAAVGATVLAISAGGDLQAQTSGRTGLVSGGLELAADRPLGGWGSGTFATEFEQRFGSDHGEAVVSHTEPVTVAAEQGTVGVLAYLAVLAASLALLAAALRSEAQQGRRLAAAAIAGGWTVVLVHSLGYAAFFTDPLTWALLALAWVLAVRPATPA